MPDQVKCVIQHGPLVADEGRPGFGLGHLVHCGLPSAAANFGVCCGKVRPGHLEVEHGLAESLVFGMHELVCLSLVLGAKACAFAGLGVHAVELIPPATPAA